MENPRWFRRVLRAVGLIGDGDTGVGGIGDRRARAVAAVVVGRARASFGRAARASIFGEACEENSSLQRKRDEICVQKDTPRPGRKGATMIDRRIDRCGMSTDVRQSSPG